ncbi:MAG: hypothetical protein V4496_07360 [Pseudomonadota bacterium]
MYYRYYRRILFTPPIKEEGFALLASDYTEEESFLNFMFHLSSEVTVKQEENVSQKCKSYAFTAVVVLVAFYGSIVFFPSALQADQRYAEMSPDWLKSTIIWGGAVAAVVTNTFFDASIYSDIFKNHNSFLQWCWYEAKDIYEKPIRNFLALLASAATILPFWYVSLTNDIVWNVFVSTAAATNIPVFYGALDMFLEVLAYAEVERFKLWCQWLLNGLFCCDLKKINDAIEYTKIKSLVIAHFLELADDFYLASDEQKQKFISLLEDAKNDEDRLSILLGNYPKSEEVLPHYHNFVRENTFLSIIKSILGLMGLLQNFGHVIESYKFGAQYHPYLGAVCALLNLLIGLAFTFSGMIQPGFLEVLFNKKPKKNKSCGDYFTRDNFFAVLVLACFVCSGMSGDQLNYDSALYVGADESLAYTIGILSGIGTALVFNLPQGIKQLWEMQLPKPLSSFDTYQKRLNEMVGETRNLPLKTIEFFVHSETTSSMAHTFFVNKKFDSSVILSNACVI